MKDALSIARQVILDEADALGALSKTIDGDLAATLETLRVAQQVLVSGLGKSGNIAQKMAASFTSTGTPAVYMHPVEALHGDLGIVTDRHCLVALSRSGNTDEIIRFVTQFRRLGGPVIGITQGRESRLAQLAQHMILLPDVPEAGPLNLAPTTSCLMTLAVGDALAMALLHARGFKPEDFAQFHPDGSLGRRLLLRAEDLMHAGDELPRVSSRAAFVDLLHQMTRKQLGLAVIARDDGTLLGTFTDGDLRRLFERVENPRALDAAQAHAKSRRDAADPPVTASCVSPDRPAVECLQLMRAGQITSLIVIDDDGAPLGVMRMADLLRAGL